MIEVIGDLFGFDGDAICIPTNGVVTHGRAVMGAGCAKAAEQRWPGLAVRLGAQISRWGNVVHEITPSRGVRLIGLGNPALRIFSFPTKHHWKASSDLALILRSAQELVRLTPAPLRVALPQVGCGLGGLTWATVGPMIGAVLVGDRYVAVERERRIG